MMIGLLLAAYLAAPAGPGIEAVHDVPNDAGEGLLVELRGMEELQEATYVVLQRSTDGMRYSDVMVRYPPFREGMLEDGLDPDFPVEPGVPYSYRIRWVTAAGDTLVSAPYASPVVATGQWFDIGQVQVLLACVLFVGLILYFFSRAQRGDRLYLRPIPGIEAIDEAIGRATEMGKPILYVPGLSTISDVATIASLTILGRVAKKVAEYQTPLMVPTADPIVYTVAEETVKQAYMEAGRPDSFDEDSVFFLTQSQFAYVAGVNGIMARQKPATNFYLGMFWAESLILAETGSLSGAIQIAGTDAVTQLPFFITTCDYTLIGEELYAASAYLGREPRQLASIKGQDWFKAILMMVIAAGLVLSLVSALTGSDLVGPLRDLITAEGGG